MNREADVERARAYLLGAVDERESDLLEEEYFQSVEALETVEAAEETLIEDYLSDRLTGTERDRFERHYMATPLRRTRVETIRRLAAAAGRSAEQLPAARAAFTRPMFAIAATLVVVAGASVWIAERSRQPDLTGRARGKSAAPPSPESAGAVASATFAFSVSPATVRGAQDTPALVVPSGTVVVDLQLEGEGAAPPVARGRVLIRTVAGDELWQGPAVAPANRPPGVVAVAEVPAARLRADDYTITLFETDASGAESERYRYSLRVRTQ
jgi:hypothetical protein